jgi:hypothetical protein
MDDDSAKGMNARSDAEHASYHDSRFAQKSASRISIMQAPMPRNHSKAGRKHKEERRAHIDVFEMMKRKEEDRGQAA